jgi:hypothetical protein
MGRQRRGFDVVNNMGVFEDSLAHGVSKLPLALERRTAWTGAVATIIRGDTHRIRKERGGRKREEEETRESDDLSIRLRVMMTSVSLVMRPRVTQ